MRRVDGASIPSLRAFVRRREVLQLYRQVLRKTRRLEPDKRHEIREYARHSIEASRHVTDLHLIGYLIADGRRRMEQLEMALYMAL